MCYKSFDTDEKRETPGELKDKKNFNRINVAYTNPKAYMYVSIYVNMNGS